MRWRTMNWLPVLLILPACPRIAAGELTLVSQERYVEAFAGPLSNPRLVSERLDAVGFTRFNTAAFASYRDQGTGSDCSGTGDQDSRFDDRDVPIGGFGEAIAESELPAGIVASAVSHFSVTFDLTTPEVYRAAIILQRNISGARLPLGTGFARLTGPTGTIFHVTYSSDQELAINLTGPNSLTGLLQPGRYEYTCRVEKASGGIPASSSLFSSGLIVPVPAAVVPCLLYPFLAPRLRSERSD